jgi:electron transfer flavoprotein alpha subunit
VAGEILVFIEQTSGAVKRPSLESLTAGAQLAASRGTTAVAVAVAAGASDAAAELGKYGAASVVSLEVDANDPTALSAALAGLVTGTSPAALLMAHTAVGKNIGPRVAGALSLPMVSDCIQISDDGGSLVARRPVYAGKALVSVTSSASTLIASMRPNAVMATEAPSAGALSAGTVVAPTKGLGAVLKDIVTAASEKLELTEAGAVVSGGRGLKDADAFGMIEELASALGAAVGASRAVVDAGWRPHSEQVGQTGKTVSPQLYIAVAISGAIQHLAGMRTSNFIVAINKDAEAPIFGVADYGIVGDAFVVVPELTKAVTALLAQG